MSINCTRISCYLYSWLWCNAAFNLTQSETSHDCYMILKKIHRSVLQHTDMAWLSCLLLRLHSAVMSTVLCFSKYVHRCFPEHHSDSSLEGRDGVHFWRAGSEFLNIYTFLANDKIYRLEIRLPAMTFMLHYVCGNTLPLLYIWVVPNLESYVSCSGYKGWNVC